MNCIETITRRKLNDTERVNYSADLFGVHFPLQVEPFVFSIADRLAETYRGGYWEFYSLSNGGFYMAPDAEETFHVSCENGFEGALSADALGITACLYAYSHLSFSGINVFAETCAQQYHWLREYMLEHPEAPAVLRATD